MKRRIPRLQLRRETIRDLGSDPLRAMAPAGGVVAPTTDPWTCTNTVTNPPLQASGFCAPRTNQCESELCQ
jgi:hypothetical protein